MSKPYNVEWEHDGCSFCHHGRMYTVVGPDDVAIGQSFGDEEMADDIAAYMNQAYERGVEDAKAGKAMPTEVECDGCDGTGLMEGWNRRDGHPCPKCKGTGKEPKHA